MRRGSKVRVLPPRGETARGNSRLWRVESFTTDESGAQLAQLVENVTDAPERRTALLDDLVVVAEFDAVSLESLRTVLGIEPSQSFRYLATEQVEQAKQFSASST